MKRLLGLSALLMACTGQLPGSFRYKQQLESFPDQQKINTKIDLLWVVDNSSSMDVSQKALRDKFGTFARKYLKPYWDIRIAVITTDTYLANPVFSGYMNKTIPGTSNYKSYYLSQYISARAGSVNPATDFKLLTLSSNGVSVTSSSATAGVFSLGLKYKDLVPGWSKGADYARLLPGVHDGPIAAFCMEKLPYFLADDNAAYPLVAGPQCKIRDQSDVRGPEGCINAAADGSSVSQCVNTVLNDSVHSNYPIITTKPDATVTDMDAWVETLVNRFIVNVSTGSSGGGSERGLGSVSEFLNVNEKSDTAFFRKDSLRGIIFLSDEDDQTMRLPELTAIPANFSPDTDYACDLPALVAANTGKFMNPSDYIQNQYGYCCPAGGGCALPSTGCEGKVLDGVTVSVGVCPNKTKLVPTTEVKDQLDTFFMGLDGVTSGANYFVVAIVPTTYATIQNLQTARYQSDDHLDILPFYSSGTLVTQARMRLPAVDKGERYMQLVDNVGNGSLSLDIGSADYSVLLDSIGKTIVQKKSVFTLTFAPSGKDEMIINVVHSDGTATLVQDNQYEYSGKTLTITDEAFVLSLGESDSISISYQPKNLK